MPAEEVPLEAGALAAAQDRIAAALEAAGVDPSARYRLRLVVEELVANLILHARFAGPPGPVRIEATPGPAGLALAIEDSAMPFDPRTPTRAPDLAGEALGGLGLPLVRRMARIVDYRHLPGGRNRTELLIRPGGDSVPGAPGPS